jgi:ubiquinone/menaquinone biosynthesis C-methylase UbiE
MIENISTDILYDSQSRNLMEEFDSLRERILEHKFGINMAGTNSLLFSIVDSIASAIGSGRRTPASLLRRKFLDFLVAIGKVRASYTNVVWTKDVVSSSTLPYPVRRAEYPWAVSQASLDRPMKILDIGSGVSLFPIYLATKGHEMLSIDNDDILTNRVSPMLAKWCDTNVRYTEGDVTKLNFDDNTFDRVFCISVLEHLEEEKVDGRYVNYHKRNLDIMAIKEMLRVLKPDGLLIMTFDWSENPEDPRSYRLQDIYDRVLGPYRKLLIEDRKPEINWEQLKAKHLEAWKSFPPYSYITDGWAMGVVLRKP